METFIHNACSLRIYDARRGRALVKGGAGRREGDRDKERGGDLSVVILKYTLKTKKPRGRGAKHSGKHSLIQELHSSGFIMGVEVLGKG